MRKGFIAHRQEIKEEMARKQMKYELAKLKKEIEDEKWTIPERHSKGHRKQKWPKQIKWNEMKKKFKFKWVVLFNKIFYDDGNIYTYMLSNVVAPMCGPHVWLLRTWNMASVIEELNS